ncbi:hypothetical protein MAPG_09803 [Magnaporthiopsis poae ATCC 64411]|uniref:N-acetyltransferase domain-containing protein n=1 Tax=Magnaporthiopsis poae (strain ATCC 64411 / 73-15) TaxID=644358 RepID=A0A0C4EAW7_MAGP6|nr:hypothetical protein MAPG_09803 [Magnaporthiopsis poae ATCC 64411]
MMEAFFGRLARRLPDFNGSRAKHGEAEDAVAADLSDVQLAIAPATIEDVLPALDMANEASKRSLFDRAMYSGESGTSYLGHRRDMLHHFILNCVDLDLYHFYVAKHPTTGDVVGFVIFSDVDAQNAPDRYTPKPGEKFLVYSLMDKFCEVTRQRHSAVFPPMRELMYKQTGGEEYLACSLLEVLPQHRGQGIEDRLLQYALAQLSPEQDGKARPVLVSPSLVELDTKLDVFTRQGWREVDHFDVDLAEWMGLYRGYGVYRFPLLRREFTSTVV